LDLLLLGGGVFNAWKKRKIERKKERKRKKQRNIVFGIFSSFPYVYVDRSKSPADCLKGMKFSKIEK
jgi:hypothetical protein